MDMHIWFDNSLLDAFMCFVSFISNWCTFSEQIYHRFFTQCWRVNELTNIYDCSYRTGTKKQRHRVADVLTILMIGHSKLRTWLTG